jgi:hypothetical protein
MELAHLLGKWRGTELKYFNLLRLEGSRGHCADISSMQRHGYLSLPNRNFHNDFHSIFAVETPFFCRSVN